MAHRFYDQGYRKYDVDMTSKKVYEVPGCITRLRQCCLSVMVHAYLRYWLPVAVMLGAAPVCLLSWFIWQVISTLLPAHFYYRLEDHLYIIYQSMVLFFFENYTGVEVIIYGELPRKKESVIYLSNHQCTVDWIIADMLAIRQNALGHGCYVLKDGLKWLPLYGWYFSQHGGIYVKQIAKFNEEAMRNKLITQSQSKNGAPMYLVIFPEGTRYNPKRPHIEIEASQAFAKKEGLAVLQHVLTPRVKATHVAIDSMKDHIDAIYDVTVAYEGTVDNRGQRKLAPSMPEFLCNECPKVHIYFERVDLKDIPKEQMFLRRWLHECFEIKDKLLTEFYSAEDKNKRNRFPGEGHVSKLSFRKTLPSVLILGGLTLSMLLTETGRKLYVIVNTCIFGTLIGCLWVNIQP
ncbi:1-acyl-sn-glycerol-3-phosphate acyltransferase epsilon-like [Protopterus annectens]|uniref:1-acyl-sn-glycerol-3-phosphate acyltransferase epsilon-like n=1 Tax=Protopterus annectens TaxID=7888 RepID=UPI001CFB2B41|nr:1-acyl-sn-glycerol-3-phosphate acyltransferase epsilon-like [Protopterus annectens]